jgi:hypothetical protein
MSLLEGLTRHPNNQFVETAPALSGPAFDELLPRIVGYRQVTDATLLHCARTAGMKLVTFDQAVGSICPWIENLLILPLALSEPAG